MTTPERVRSLVEPLVADAGLDLYDLELNGGILRVVVDHTGGVGMDAIASLTRAISRGIDEHDPIDGHFTLEVSSPGLERQLRIPAHYVGAVGTPVTVKTVAGFEGARRIAGTLLTADDDGITVEVESADEPVSVPYDAIERARTVFEWGPTPKPGKGPSSKAKSKSKSKSPTKPAAKAARASRPGSSASPNEKVPTS